MATNNSANQDFTNNSDGFVLGGGTTERKLTVTGGNVTLTGSGTNVYTLPAATDTLIGRASTDALTNKTIDAAATGNSITNIGPSSLATGAAKAAVATSESTTSTTYADLTTTTDSVTVTIGTNGLALVSIYANMLNTVASSHVHVSFAVSGASTQAAADGFDIEYVTPPTGASWNHAAGATFLLTGLTAGSTTFKMKYRANSSTGTFSNRKISVVPL